MKNCLLYFLLLIALVGISQNTRVGEWAMHLNYTNTNTMIEANNKIYIGTKAGLFSYNTVDNSLSTYSKLDGLSGLNITALAHDEGSQSVFIGYDDGHIDILQNNLTININDIYYSNILGAKTINSIFIDNNLAYISCDFGLVIFNIEKLEVKETCYFYSDGEAIEVYSTHIFDSDINSEADNFLANKIFVGTSDGLFYANKNDNLLNYNNWKNDSKISFSEGVYGSEYDLVGTSVKEVVGFDKKGIGGKQLIIGTNIDYSSMVVPWLGLVEYNLFQFNTFAYTESVSANLNLFQVNTSVPGDIINIDYSEQAERALIIVNDNFTEKIIVLEKCLGCVDPNWMNSVLSVNTQELDTDNIGLSLSCGLLDSNYGSSKRVFLGDSKFGGLIAHAHNNTIAIIESLEPNGPAGINVGAIVGSGSSLMLTHGGKNTSWGNAFNTQEISFFDNHRWSRSDGLIGENIYDAVSVCGGTSPNQFFVGTWNSGLLEFVEDSLVNQYNSKNTGGELQSIIGTGGWIRVGGVDIDDSNAVWLTSSQTEKPLVKFSNNTWTGFSVPNIPSNVMSGKIMCASNGQKWIQLRNEGVVVARETDEGVESRKIGTANGLPSQTVNCFVEDNDGTIWVGTSQGLAVFYFPSEIFNSPTYNAEYILIETEDGYVERLFENTEILDIKIDGGNRKWVATKSNGAFLISEDGSSQTHNFTKENSPILDNTIYEIGIVKSSGEVFFTTASGVCSYRSDATLSSNGFNEARVFPNPVRRNYSGLISITGLSDKTNVKITDISGNLVFETTSFGGTATWNGKNFDGKKVSTGIYLFLCTSESFDQSIIQKVLIYN